MARVMVPVVVVMVMMVHPIQSLPPGSHPTLFTARAGHLYRQADNSDNRSALEKSDNIPGFKQREKHQDPSDAIIESVSDTKNRRSNLNDTQNEYPSGSNHESNPGSARNESSQPDTKIITIWSDTISDWSEKFHGSVQGGTTQEYNPSGAKGDSDLNANRESGPVIARKESSLIAGGLEEARAIVDVVSEGPSGEVSYIIHPDNQPPPTYQPLQNIPTPAQVAKWRPDIFMKVCCSPLESSTPPESSATSGSSSTHSESSSTESESPSAHSASASSELKDPKASSDSEGGGLEVKSGYSQVGTSAPPATSFSEHPEEVIHLAPGEIQEGKEDSITTIVPDSNSSVSTQRSSGNAARPEAANSHTPRYEESSSSTYESVANFLKDIASSEGFQNAFLGDLIKNFGNLDQNAMKLIYSLLIRPLESANAPSRKQDRLGKVGDSNRPLHLSPQDLAVLEQDRLPLRDRPDNGYQPFKFLFPQVRPSGIFSRPSIRPSLPVHHKAPRPSDGSWHPGRTDRREPAINRRGDETVDVITAPPFQTFEVVLGSSLNSKDNKPVRIGPHIPTAHHNTPHNTHSPPPGYHNTHHSTPHNAQPPPPTKLRLGLEMPPPDALEALPPGSVLIPPSQILGHPKLAKLLPQQVPRPSQDVPALSEFLPNLPFFNRPGSFRPPPPKPQVQNVAPRLPGFLSSILPNAPPPRPVRPPASVMPPSSTPIQPPSVVMQPPRPAGAVSRNDGPPPYPIRRPPSGPPPVVTKMTPPAMPTVPTLPVPLLPAPAEPPPHDRVDSVYPPHDRVESEYPPHDRVESEYPPHDRVESEHREYANGDRIEHASGHGESEGGHGIPSSPSEYYDDSHTHYYDQVYEDYYQDQGPVDHQVRGGTDHQPVTPPGALDHFAHQASATFLAGDSGALIPPRRQDSPVPPPTIPPTIPPSPPSPVSAYGGHQSGLEQSDYPPQDTHPGQPNLDYPDPAYPSGNYADYPPGDYSSHLDYPDYPDPDYRSLDDLLGVVKPNRSMTQVAKEGHGEEKLLHNHPITTTLKPPPSDSPVEASDASPAPEEGLAGEQTGREEGKAGEGMETKEEEGHQTFLGDDGGQEHDASVSHLWKNLQLIPLAPELFDTPDLQLDQGDAVNLTSLLDGGVPISPGSTLPDTPPLSDEVDDVEAEEADAKLMAYLLIGACCGLALLSVTGVIVIIRFKKTCGSRQIKTRTRLAERGSVESISRRAENLAIGSESGHKLGSWFTGRNEQLGSGKLRSNMALPDVHDHRRGRGAHSGSTRDLLSLSSQSSRSSSPRQAEAPVRSEDEEPRASWLHDEYRSSGSGKESPSSHTNASPVPQQHHYPAGSIGELERRSAREHHYTGSSRRQGEQFHRSSGHQDPRYLTSIDSEDLEPHIAGRRDQTDSELDDTTTHYDEDESCSPSRYCSDSRELEDVVGAPSMTSQELGDHLSRDLRHYQSRHAQSEAPTETEEGVLRRSHSQASFSRDTVQNEVFLELDNILRQHANYPPSDPAPSTLGRTSRATDHTRLSVSRANTPDSIDLPHPPPSLPTTPPRFSPPPAPPRPPKPGHLSQPGTPSPTTGRGSESAGSSQRPVYWTSEEERLI